MSSYRLNTDQIAAMVGDNVMPPHPSILAATVGVTFVGPKNLPAKSMPGFLRVNRARVRMALAWLKINNPIYGDINISDTRLNELPEDDIPPEIWSLAKHSNDTGLLAKEMDGYVPEDPTDDEGMIFSRKMLFTLTSVPGFVPGISGVLDVDATNRDDDVGLHEFAHEGMTCLDTFVARSDCV